MGILICGLNHKSAPIDVRERLAVAPENHSTYLQSAYEKAAINEVAIISTCNRTELICETQHAKKVLSWLSEVHLKQNMDLQEFVYIHYNRAAVRHLMRVACGLDSMVLGEPQILGQLKQAYHYACQAGTIGPELGAVFRAVFAATKKVRSNTAIGLNPVSMASAAVFLAKKHCPDLSSVNTLLLGAGDTIELASRYLRQSGVKKFLIANRTKSRAEDLAKRNGASCISLDEITRYLPSVDLVISATAATETIIDKQMVETAMQCRKQDPMLLIDLAMPRDIAANVAEISQVSLSNIDDLEAIIEDSFIERRDAARQAEQIIELELEKYSRWLNYLKAVDAIRSYRESMRDMANQEIEQATKSLENGVDPVKSIEVLARRLINKAMHLPTTRLRQAGFHDRQDLLKLAKYLLSD